MIQLLKMTDAMMVMMSASMEGIPLSVPHRRENLKQAGDRGRALIGCHRIPPDDVTEDGDRRSES